MGDVRPNLHSIQPKRIADMSSNNNVKATIAIIGGTGTLGET